MLWCGTAHLCVLTFTSVFLLRRSSLVTLRLLTVKPGFFYKENVMYPVCTCRDPISLILGTRFSLILGTRIGSLKHLKNTLRLTVFHKRVLRAAAVKRVRDISQLGYIVSACSKTAMQVIQSSGPIHKSFDWETNALLQIQWPQINFHKVLEQLDMLGALLTTS